MSVTYPDTLTFNWDLVGEQDILLDLIALEGYYRDTTAPLAVSKLIAIRDTAEHFDKEEAPDGTGWQYWADSYAFTAESENVGILRKSEDMYYAAISPSSFEITPEGLFFSTTNLDNNAPFWYTHQYGRDKPAMVARPFIGLSDAAQTEIDGIFEKWVETGGEVFTRGGKRVEAHVFFGPGHRFVSAK